MQGNKKENSNIINNKNNCKIMNRIVKNKNKQLYNIIKNKYYNITLIN